MHRVTLPAITKDGRVGYVSIIMKGAEQRRSFDKMRTVRTHDIEISEPIQPLAAEQRPETEGGGGGDDDDNK